MNHLLKAMGFWMWGLIAIVISLSLVTLSYRTLSALRPPAAADMPVDKAEHVANADAAIPLPREVGIAASTGGQPMISKLIGKEMKSAQREMRNNQWQAALLDLEAARSKSPLTPFDVKTIEEFTGFSNIRLNELTKAQKNYEAAVASGAYSAEELVRIFHSLFQLAATNKRDAKAIEYGKYTVDAVVATRSDLLIMAQLYYQQKDCKNSAALGDQALAAFKTAGEPPKAVLYQMKLQCAEDIHDSEGMKTALYDLVRLTNGTAYWNNLLRLERQDERDDRNTLMIYRVMFDTNSMNADTDYIEMAQLLGDAGLAGEARAVLEKAMKLNVLTDEHKERVARLLNAMTTRADADNHGLPALLADASKGSDGELDLNAGEIYFGMGDFQNASNAISRSIGKGQIKNPVEAYVSLARAFGAQRDLADADKAFAQLKTLPSISPRVLRLWSLYADTRREPLPAAASSL